MKKVLAMVLALAMVLCCTAALAEEAETFVGLGVQTGIGSSSDASADGDGKAQVDSAIAVVGVDKDGVIQFAIIDAAQTKIAFSIEGKITADTAAEIKTKTEKGTEYGMKSASPIGLEWDEQIAGLEDWLVGKTVADLKTAYEGKDETLLAVCTIHLDDTIAALEKAVANALAE